jgi:hypothetical protein
MTNPTKLSHHAIVGSHYGFSATRIDDLGAAEYTLVAIAADASGSVGAFRRRIEKAIAEVALACKSSPRADNLMLRVLRFDNDLHEIHGFVPLPAIDAKRYDGCVEIGGATALYDAAHNAIGSVTRYGQDLADDDFEVNGIVFVITDGGDNASSARAATVKNALEHAVTSEALESMIAVLVGVNIDAATSRTLSKVKSEAGFHRYIELQDATASSLAKLADFVSRSIGAQSKALGTGHAGAALTF